MNHKTEKEPILSFQFPFYWATSFSRLFCNFTLIISVGIKRKSKEPSKDSENQHPNIPAAKKSKTANGISPSKIVARPVTLNKEQNMVLDAVMRGRSVFFTGSAGTGKSFLLKRIIGKSHVHLIADIETGPLKHEFPRVYDCFLDCKICFLVFHVNA